MKLTKIKKWLEYRKFTGVVLEDNEVFFLTEDDNGKAKISIKDLKDILLVSATPVFCKETKKGMKVNPLIVGEKKIYPVMTYMNGITAGWPYLHYELDPVNGTLCVQAPLLKPEIVYDDGDEPESLRYRLNMLSVFMYYMINGLMDVLSSKETPVEIYERQIEEIKKDKKCKPFIKL